MTPTHAVGWPAAGRAAAGAREPAETADTHAPLCPNDGHGGLRRLQLRAPLARITRPRSNDKTALRTDHPHPFPPTPCSKADLEALAKELNPVVPFWDPLVLADQTCEFACLLAPDPSRATSETLGRHE